jgi:hypothetical protein
MASTSRIMVVRWRGDITSTAESGRRIYRVNAAESLSTQ